jgi:hypothetical protein
MVLTACGGGSDETPRQQGEGAPPLAAGVDAGCVPPANPQPSMATAFPGDPPGSGATERIDRIMTAARLPANVTVFGRRDLTNDGESRGDAALLKRFTDAGRQTGGLYILNVDGQQRISLGVNLYDSADNARKDFANLRPSPDLPRIDAGDLGENAAAARVTLGSGGAQAFINNLVFQRGCYVVTLADFVGSPDAPPDTALAVARALDDQFKTNPNP